MNNKGLKITIVILTLIVITLGTYIIYDKIFVPNILPELKEQDGQNEESAEENAEDKPIELFTWSNSDFVIPDSEIQKLYSYVESDDLNYSNRNYYANTFNKRDIEALTTIVLEGYGQEFIRIVDNNLMEKIPNLPSYFLNSSNYIAAENIRNGLELIFNIDKNEIIFEPENHESYNLYTYYKNADVFVSGDGGNSIDYWDKYKIISYLKSTDEIAMTVVKAELHENVDEFEFTKENIENYPQVKFIFRKSKNNNFFVYDIIKAN